MDLIHHVVGCAIGCVLAHWLQQGLVKWFNRKSQEVVTSNYLQPRRTKPYTVGGKIKPKVNNDFAAFEKESGR